MQDDGQWHQARHRQDVDDSEWSVSEENGRSRSRFANSAGWVVGIAAGCLIFAVVAIVVRTLNPKGPGPSALSTTRPAAIDFTPIPDGQELPPALSAMSATALPAATATSSAKPGATGTAKPSVTSSPSVPPSPSGQQQPPPVTTYSAVAGYGCTPDVAKGFLTSGEYTDGQAGWLPFSSGAWAQNGCNGSYVAMPMFGSLNQYTPDAFGQWWFAVGTASTSCEISTYVPSTSVPRNVSGKPAIYQIRNTEAGPVVQTFSIDQRIQRGVWVTAGTFAVTGGRLVIRVIDSGVDWDASGPTYEHIAVAQIRAVCH